MRSEEGEGRSLRDRHVDCYVAGTIGRCQADFDIVAKRPQ